MLADVNEAALEIVTSELRRLGRNVLAVKCDVSDESQAAAVIERAVAEFGRLDMAFNNAGIAGPSGPFLEETAEQFDQVNAVNLRGVCTCTKHELKQMRAQGSGAVVNCSSLGGLVGQTGRAAYHAANFGVITFEKRTPMFAALTEKTQMP